MNDAEMQVFDWDDSIENDGKEFVTLEEGNYDFEVTEFERAYYQPGPNSSLPACNMAVVTLCVKTPEGNAYIQDKLHLCSKMEWKLSSFFRSIGLKKHGKKLAMKWDKVPGARGKAHITKDEGTKKPGTFFNNVGYYIDPVAGAASASDDTWS